MVGHHIVNKLDPTQTDTITPLKLTGRSRPHSFPVYQNTVAAAQVFDSMTPHRPNDFGMLT